MGNNKIRNGLSKSPKYATIMKFWQEKQQNIHPVNCERSTTCKLDDSDQFVSAQHRLNPLILPTEPNDLEETKKVETGGKLEPKFNTTAEMT